MEALESRPTLLKEYAEAMAAKLGVEGVDLLLVTGSGLGASPERGWTQELELPMSELAPFEVWELEGHGHQVTLLERDGRRVLLANGRFHLYQGYDANQVAFMVRLAAFWGARYMVATNSTGALDPTIEPGSVVVVRDHINLQGANPLVGAWSREQEPPFPDMTVAYDPRIAEMAHRCLDDAGLKHRDGIYVGVLGPSFETPAEVKMLASIGATVVGMSTVCEVIAARQLGMRVCVMSLAANLAAGLAGKPLSHTEVIEAGQRAASKLNQAVMDLVEAILDED